VLASDIMIDPDKTTDSEIVSRIIGKVSKEKRGKYAEETARVYLDKIEKLGGFGPSKLSKDPEVYQLVDCMDVAIHVAKQEYMESKDKKGLERLGLFSIEALTRKNAVDCLRAVDTDISPGAKVKLDWLEDENNKQKHIELGLCDNFDIDYRKKKQ